jgi:CubicO group peptidase (beta-lactamase class C family)
MQRMLVTVAVIALVLTSLTVGALAAHWPFWQRAWQWQSTADHWPAQLPGPIWVLQPSTAPLALHVVADARLVPRAGDGATEMVLVGDARGWAAYWSAPSVDVNSPIDGRGLASSLLAPLFGALQQQTARSFLDMPVRVLIDEWRDDARGQITPRQLFWEMSGLAADDFVPLNPFSRRAQLSSGPDFNRAALHTPLSWPPGSHFEPSPANAQLLSLVAGALDGNGYAPALQRRLWGRFAEHEAQGQLDHRRGNLAAHCCLRAVPLDWLRLGLVLAADGVIANERLLPEGFVAQMTMASPVHPVYGLGYHLTDSQGARVLVAMTLGRRLAVSPRTGRAVLWVGKGVPPGWLDELLLPAMFGLPDSGAGR